MSTIWQQSIGLGGINPKQKQSAIEFVDELTQEVGIFMTQATAAQKVIGFICLLVLTAGWVLGVWDFLSNPDGFLVRKSAILGLIFLALFPIAVIYTIHLVFKGRR